MTDTGDTVTQADRDAVDEFHRQSFKALFETTDDEIENDINRAHKLLVQAFARHRQASTQELVEALEPFANVTILPDGTAVGLERHWFERARTTLARFRGEA